MGKKLSIYNLDDYGLTYSKFLRLKNLVKIKIRLKYPKQENFFPFKPDDRRIKINEALKQGYDKLVKILPHQKYRSIKAAKGYRGVEIVMLPKEVKKLENKNYIDSVWIEEIEGLRKKKKKIKREKLWYAVRANFSIQIEDFKGGLHQYEDRIIVVKAYDHEDAEKVAEKEFREYSDNPYLNTDLRMVRWHYEKITDVFEMLSVCNDKFSPSGTEVYSKFRMRKLKPEYEWHPIKKYKKI